MMLGAHIARCECGGHYHRGANGTADFVTCKACSGWIRVSALIDVGLQPVWNPEDPETLYLHEVGS